MKNQILRLLASLFFLVSAHAFAETIPATTGSAPPSIHTWVVDGVDRGSLSAACEYSRSSQGYASVLQCYPGTFDPAYAGSPIRAQFAVGNGSNTGIDTPGYAYDRCSAGTWNNQTNMCDGALSCPSGQGWTLSGQSCTRPDCVAPNVRQPDGTCGGLCNSKANTSAGGGWITSPIGGDPTGDSCDGGCQVSTSLDLSAADYYTDGKTKTMKYTQTFTGQSCTSEPPKAPTTDPVKAPTTPPKKPPCATGEGVMTSSSGTIACVLEGAPGSNPPIVTKKKETQNFPDGSSKTDETTTTRDPATGVEVKDVKTTRTPATGGTTGEAGTPGVTNGSTETGTRHAGDPNKPGDSDFCAKNPNLQMCKGGMNEEATQKKVEENTKKITDQLSADNLNPNEHFLNADATPEAKQEANDAVTSITDGVNKFGTPNDPANSLYDSWKMHMSTGWFSPITFQSCQPFSQKVGPWTWAFDHCPTAQKISDIGAYCMWIFLLFSVFSMTTREGR